MTREGFSTAKTGRPSKVVFHLAKYFPPIEELELEARKQYRGLLGSVPETLFNQIGSFDKTSEWREFTPYWLGRLTSLGQQDVWKMKDEAKTEEAIDLSKALRVHTAWFMEGYPKNNVPRIEAEIIGLFYWPDTKQLEIKFRAFKLIDLFNGKARIFVRDADTWRIAATETTLQ